jgi:hypothetical protein
VPTNDNRVYLSRTKKTRRRGETREQSEFVDGNEEAAHIYAPARKQREQYKAEGQGDDRTRMEALVAGEINGLSHPSPRAGRMAGAGAVEH